MSHAKETAKVAKLAVIPDLPEEELKAWHEKLEQITFNRKK